MKLLQIMGRKTHHLVTTARCQRIKKQTVRLIETKPNGMVIHFIKRHDHASAFEIARYDRGKGLIEQKMPIPKDDVIDRKGLTIGPPAPPVATRRYRSWNRRLYATSRPNWAEPRETSHPNAPDHHMRAELPGCPHPGGHYQNVSTFRRMVNFAPAER